MNTVRFPLLKDGRRVIAGVLSGTSMDGVDVAIIEVEGHGKNLSLDTKGFRSIPYSEELREAVGRCASRETSDVWLVSQLHARLGEVFASAIEDTCREIGVDPGDLGLIGSHGQTIHHVPEATPVAGEPTRSTFQIGDPARMAARIGVPVVADFRGADMALGGQGAPLAPALDVALFSSSDESRVALNLGGIANVTILPKNGTDTVIAFDTGPANVLIDILAKVLFDVPFDADGALAAQGEADDEVVNCWIQEEPYFHRLPPKSTGRELFTEAYAQRLQETGPSDPHDLLASVTRLTARTVAEGIGLVTEARPDRVIVSGGGTKNQTLLRDLAAELNDVPVETSDAFGIDPDAKEAVLFAYLAHAFVDGVKTGIPNVTGASRSALQGALWFP